MQVRRYFLCPPQFESHTKYTADKYKSNFGQEFPLDAAGSGFFSLARKRAEQLERLQYMVSTYPEDFPTTIWDLLRHDVEFRIRIPFPSSDPRHRSMLDDRECSSPFAHRAH
jgi:hypothetical protein